MGQSGENSKVSDTLKISQCANVLFDPLAQSHEKSSKKSNCITSMAVSLCLRRFLFALVTCDFTSLCVNYRGSTTPVCLIQKSLGAHFHWFFYVRERRENRIEDFLVFIS